MITPFRTLTSRAAVLDRADVDTDQIVPKQFLKRIERAGFGAHLFHDWRFHPDGRPRPEFELNRPEAAGARILLAGRNFGCGSSREHAAWALEDYGFRVVIAPSFGDIFHTNALKIGLVAIRLAPDEVKRLMEVAHEGGELTVDLVDQTIETPAGERIAFPFDAHARTCLLEGLDEIALTSRREAGIAAFEELHPARTATTALAGALP